jgi:hypothetical protein
LDANKARCNAAGFFIMGSSSCLPRNASFDMVRWQAIGAPTFGLGSLFGKLQIYPRSLGITLLSGGLIWLGVRMLA